MNDIEIPEGFTRWDGGECPVDPSSDVRVICRDGEQFNALASCIAWWLPHLGCDIEIIAYRVLP